MIGLWGYAYREAKGRPARTLLTVLSIALGVATVVSIGRATTAVRQASAELQRKSNGGVALEVGSVDGAPFSARVVPALRRISGIRLAVPLFRQYTKLYLEEGRRIPASVLGIDLAVDRDLRNYEITEGRFLAGKREVLISVSLARELKIHPDQEIAILTRRGISQLKVVGLFAEQDMTRVLDAVTLVTALDDACDLFRRNGRISSVQLALNDPRREHDVAAEVTRSLPANMVVTERRGQGGISDEILIAIERGMTMCGWFCLVLAGFVSLNAYLMSVGERRRQIALLRAVGATRKQVCNLLLREGVVLGLAGSALGLAVGLVAERSLGKLFEKAFAVQLASTPVALSAALIAFALGVGASLAAAYIPARLASRFGPMESIVYRPSESRKRSYGPLLPAGLLGACAAVVLLALCYKGFLPPTISSAFIMLLVISLALLVCASFDPLAAAIRAALAPLGRAEADLAHSQVMKNRTRTALTFGVLFVATAVSVGISSSSLDLLGDVNTWIRKAVPGDYIVLAGMPQPGARSDSMAALPGDLGGEISQLSGVRFADRIGLLPAKVSDLPTVLIARDFNHYDDLPLHAEGDEVKLKRGLGEGEAVLGAKLASRLGIQAPRTVNIKIGEEAYPIRVAGIVSDYSTGGDALFMEREAAERLFGLIQTSAVIVVCKPDSQHIVEKGLRTISEREKLIVLSQAELQGMFHQLTTGIVASLWMLLALVFLVAGLGMATVLSMNVFEQTREIGLLRVVGMRRRDVRRMVLMQASMIGLIGILPGGLAGLAVAYLSTLFSRPILGQAVPFAHHNAFLAGTLLSGFLLILAAAWLPALRAARVNMMEALRVE